MKRAGELFAKIVDRENLRVAFYNAACRKRHRAEVQEFSHSLESNLAAIKTQLLAGTFPFGRINEFTIYDPKRRIIAAPAFAERVTHHAIMNICEPWFDRFLISDTFACRKGKGRIRCLERASQFARKYKYCVKLDMRSYFHSISHDHLKELLRRKFKDQRLLAVFDAVVDSYSTMPGTGLPIGSLTSQHFANFFLGWFDHFIKNSLRIKGYVRYMDDCVLWSDSRSQLNEYINTCTHFLNHELALNPKPTQVDRTQSGMDFLGCKVHPTHLSLSLRSKRRFKKKMAELTEELNHGRLDQLGFGIRAQSLTAFATAGGTKSWGFRNEFLNRKQVDSHGG